MPHDRAAGRLQLAHDEFRERRLALAVRADQSEPPALLDGEGDVRQQRLGRARMSKLDVVEMNQIAERAQSGRVVEFDLDVSLGRFDLDLATAARVVAWR